jgi:hypothetical protein
MLLLSFGCGNGRPPLVQVDCFVTLDEQPLESGILRLESRGNRPTRGEIVAGKVVSWETFEPGDGVPPGEHQIAIHSFVENSESAPATTTSPESGPVQTGGIVIPKSRIPSRYTNPETSGLTARVDISHPAPISIHLESK